jgi:sigma-B regulation protein RsbU (phosphoserine phosphatase)
MPPRVIDQPEIFLEVRDTSGQSLQVPLDDQPLIIGRAKDSNLRLRSDGVRDYHAELYVDPFGQWWLRNLGSVDDLHVNGGMVHRDEALESGDAITIDTFNLTFVDRGAEAESDYSDPAIEKKSAEDSKTLLVPPPLDLSQQDPAAKTQRIAPIGNMFGGHEPIVETPSSGIDTIHLSTLTEFGQRLMKTPRSSERLRMLCRLMVRSDFHGSAAVALRLAKGNSRLVPGKLCTAQSARGGNEMPHISKGLLGSVLKSNAPAVATIKSGSMKVAAVACPIKDRDRYLDMLYMTLPQEFGTQEWLSLIALASQQYEQAEVALKLKQQAEKQSAIDQQLEIAGAIQKRLIPSDPSVGGLDVAVGFRPCHQIGGDYADAVDIGDGKVLLVAADVCGKGLAASLVTSTLHTMVHAFAIAGSGVEQVVDPLNHHLCTYMEDIPFVSFCAVEIDTNNGKLKCINAGHPPAIIVDQNGNARRFQEGQNSPLGIANEPFVMEEDRLKKGQMLTMYTYGVIEQANSAGVLGIGKLSEMIASIYQEMATFEIGDLRTIFNEKMDSFLKDTKPIDDRAFLFARRSKTEEK